MNEYVIFTDSNADLSIKQVMDMDIHIIPMKYDLDGTTYVHGDNAMPIKKFYSKLREGSVSVTTQINADEFKEFFKPVLDEGKDVIYVAFSSALSGSYQSAIIARKELMQEYPDRKIVVVDSLCASMGQGLLLHYAVEQKRNGLDIETLGVWIDNNKLRLCHLFTVNDLMFLKRGGRLSSASAIIGTILSIKPILHVDNEGRLVPISKVRGRNQALEGIVSKMKETIENPKDQIIFISHGDCLEDAEYTAKLIKSKLGVKKVVCEYVSPVVGSHSGPGTIAVFFLGSKR